VAGLRAQLAAHAAALGFEAEAVPVRAAGSTLWALPAFGVALLAAALPQLAFLPDPSAPPLAALAALLGVVGSGAGLAAAIGAGLPPFRWDLRDDATLVLRRPSASPRRWVVAHLDSKGQGHSMAGRLVAVWAIVVALLASLGAGVGRAVAGPLPVSAAALVAGLLATAGALCLRGRPMRGSPGARDNASGVVALLGALPALPPGTGAIVTAAEELGLVGARMLARARPALVRGAEVVNLDTLDDAGPAWLVHHDAAGAALAARLAPALSRALGMPVRSRRLPAGILVDSQPLAAAGAAAVTLARLDWRTLARIHTHRDSPEGFALATARAVGEALPAALTRP